MRPLIFLAVFAGLPALSANAVDPLVSTISDDTIRALLIEESIAAYSG